MTSILEHTRVVIQKGTSVHVFDLSTKWQVILFYDLIKIFIINSIYKYCIPAYSISFLKIHLWLLCYNGWPSRIRIWFIGWFRIISAILNRVADSTENVCACVNLVANQSLVDSQRWSWIVSCAVSATSLANRASSTAVCGTIQQHQQQIKHLSNLRHKSGFFRL